jgi:hypothetical protein
MAPSNPLTTKARKTQVPTEKPCLNRDSNLRPLGLNKSALLPTVPFRSAIFSQLQLQPGKYIVTVLELLRVNCHLVKILTEEVKLKMKLEVKHFKFSFLDFF